MKNSHVAYTDIDLAYNIRYISFTHNNLVCFYNLKGEIKWN